MEIESGGELSPRYQLGSSPYDFTAAKAGTSAFSYDASFAAGANNAFFALHSDSAMWAEYAQLTDWDGIMGMPAGFADGIESSMGIGISPPEGGLHLNYAGDGMNAALIIQGDSNDFLNLLFRDEDTGNEFEIIGHETFRFNVNDIIAVQIDEDGDVGLGTNLVGAIPYRLTVHGGYAMNDTDKVAYLWCHC
ncbi:hypothetical protein J7M00_03035 [bacterium]|nr:hypothetical protein [bacterium]